MTTKRWTRRPEGSNWGDFGPDDQLGMMNTLTPEMRLAAVREVKEGLAFALSLPLDYPGGEPPDAGRKRPKLFALKSGEDDLYNALMTPSDLCCDDGVVMSLQYSTQWDAFSHWGRMFDVDGSGVERPVYYNGFRAHDDIVSPRDGEGPHADRLGIENLAATGVQGRGVMIDLARAYGTGKSVVGYDELMRAIEAQKVEVRKGDFLMFHTGYGDVLMSMRKQPDQAKLFATAAGLDGNDQRLGDWIEQSGVVALISDNPAVETFTYDGGLVVTGHNGALPLHDRCLFKLGIHLGEMWYLGDLARHLEKTGRHAFLLTAPPLRLPGAVGSPVTPVATV
jgi:kynurenine formamidase